MLPYLTDLFVLLWQWNNHRHWRPVFWGWRLKKVVNFSEEKKCTPEKILAMTPTPGDLAWGFSDLKMTWLLYCLAPPRVRKWRYCCELTKKVPVWHTIPLPALS